MLKEVLLANTMKYICPMCPEVISNKPGACPKCGMDLVPEEEAPKKEEHHNHVQHHLMMEQDFKRRFWFVLPLTIITLLLSPKIQEWFGFAFRIPTHDLVLFVLGTIIVSFGGLPFYRAAKDELARRQWGMMTLVSLAVLSGYIFSVAATFLFPGESLYWEISTLVLAFLFGHWMEMRAVRGTTGALSELAKLIPLKANLLKNGRVQEVDTEELKKGNQVLVRPGEKIPIDGIVVKGESSVNEAMITGESRPVGKKEGGQVIGGTINIDGSLTVEVTKTGRETALSQIMDLIRQAQETKPPTQKLADKAANILTLIAIVVGSGTFIFWFFINPQGAIFAATLAITVIVITCPHALGLAIPTVTTITSTLAAQNGILIKDMKGLETARKLDYVIFDKTGTLTLGEFGVTDVASFGKESKEEVLKTAASVDFHSQHSIGKGVVREAQKQKISFKPATQFKTIPGKGATGRLAKNQILVGNKAMMQDFGLKPEKFSRKIEKLVKEGKTFVWVGLRQAQARQARILGVIALEDLIREESKEAMSRLKKLGMKVAMLTGDSQSIAASVAKKLGIDAFFAEVLPEEKVKMVKRLQRGGKIVAMVGDGVNDAPSLTQANVGIAIGTGTDVAVESAEIVLVKNDPRDVARLIHLSQKTDSKMKQNLAWATGYNLFAIPIAAGILYPWGILLRPEWGALLMSASSIIVVLNALLLRKEKI